LQILDAAKSDPAVARKLAIGIVFIQTLLGAAAQILMKGGAQSRAGDGFADIIAGIFQSPQLFFGYALYGVSAMLMIVALKYGELSILYPVIAMTYVWVTFLSVMIYSETVNGWKVAGLTSIVLGVAVLGFAGSGRKP
jgi:drug/metabolite transporter (DMT)-like permease